MVDSAIYHRTFSTTTLPSIRYLIDKRDPDGAWDAGARPAYSIAGKRLVPAVIIERKDQQFEKYATWWEQWFSILVRGRYMVAEPVVDKNGVVIGHLGWFDIDNVLQRDAAPAVALGTTDGNAAFSEQIRSGGIVVGNMTGLDTGIYKHVAIVPQQKVRLLTDIEGRALGYLGFQQNTETPLEAEAITPVDLVLITKVLVDVGGYAGGKIIGTLATRTGSSEGGALVVREIAAGVADVGSGVGGKAGSELAPEAEALLGDTPPRPGLRVLVVGPETPEEFDYALKVNAGGGRATAVNPHRTAAADQFKARGGDFVQGKVEGLPKEAAFDIIREDYPFPTGDYIDFNMIDARLSRLKPRGAWVVITEKEDFANTLETAAQHRGAKVIRGVLGTADAPVSAHPKDPLRFGLLITR